MAFGSYPGQQIQINRSLDNTNMNAFYVGENLKWKVHEKFLVFHISSGSSMGLISMGHDGARAGRGRGRRLGSIRPIGADRGRKEPIVTDRADWGRQSQLGRPGPIFQLICMYID